MGLSSVIVRTPGTFTGNLKLQEVWLSNNKLTRLEEGTIEITVAEGAYVRLNNNMLDTIASDAIRCGLLISRAVENRAH